MADVAEAEIPQNVQPQEVEPAPALPVAQSAEKSSEEAKVVAADDHEKDALTEKISSKVKQAFLPEDGEFMLAKNYLGSKMGVKHPVSMYDHLTSIIMHSLESKSANIVGKSIY